MYNKLYLSSWGHAPGRSSVEILSPFEFFKPLIIITSYGSHHPVPEQKVQPIISLEILMVQVMIDGSVDPFTQPVPAKTFWINLITRMAVHIINNRKQKENGQMKTVNGNGEKKYGYDANLNNPF
jgi:hypothetical protein